MVPKGIYFGVGDQNLENLLIRVVQEGEYMRHVGVLAFPISWLHQFIHLSQAAFGIHSSCESFMMSLWVFAILSIQFITIFIVWFLSVVDKEIDTCGQEVGGRCLEELVATTT